MTVGTGTTRRILMLHGFVQSGKIFSAKTGGLRKSLKKLGYELYYPTGPITVDKNAIAKLYGWQEQDLASEFDSSDCADQIYGWYLRDGPGLDDFKLEERVLDYLHDYIIENGPFEGIMGFSQGAGLAGYLLTDFNQLLRLTEEQQPKLKFFVSFSGFKFNADQFQESYGDKPIEIRSLHVQGELDSVVSEERSMKLYNCFDTATRQLIKHPGGHFVPNSKTIVTNIANWIQNSESTEKGPTPATTSRKPDGPDLDDDLMDMINSMGKI
ncbi:hypothetical protein HG537_0C01680 [Torulaspora globosa]|uniref:Serine hydrolase domain-containing protein n=1 Tax=Torulaspora globosa TaxID=48254 RepID=A0A7H9HQG5_9SACH|nr:hypothetical protein HG537_0C01680 [Torulaspora sp. CBS 2947]